MEIGCFFLIDHCEVGNDVNTLALWVAFQEVQHQLPQQESSELAALLGDRTQAILNLARVATARCQAKVVRQAAGPWLPAKGTQARERFESRERPVGILDQEPSPARRRRGDQGTLEPRLDGSRATSSGDRAG